MNRRTSNRRPLRIVGEKVVSQREPEKVLGTNPTHFGYLAANCKAAIATMTTGEVHIVVKKVVNS